MNELQMGAAEERFADMIWGSEPVTTVELVRRAREELEWKKTTAYTVLKRLCEKGFFRNDGGVVTSVISRQEFDTRRSRQFVRDSFGGSLPAFLAAFSAGKGLTPQEAQELRALVDSYRED